MPRARPAALAAALLAALLVGDCSPTMVSRRGGRNYLVPSAAVLHHAMGRDPDALDSAGHHAYH